MRRTTLSALSLLVCVGASQAHAHGMRTAYLELNQQASGIILAKWKVSVPDDTVAPQFPSDCTTQTDGVAGSPNLRSFVLHCPRDLAGEPLAVRGLGPVLTEAVVRVVRPDGEVLSQVLTPALPSWLVPGQQSWRAVSLQYTALGIRHILNGADHLLFLLALVLYVRRPRAVFITETAFTLSHSVSFSATALGLIHLSARAAEACIAMSLILAALQASEPSRNNADSRGALLALVFGLVHGLGFASGLSEIGLPDHAVAAALVSFGLGVELGQVAFLLLVMCLLAAAARLVPLQRLALGGSYLVGVTGSFWFFQRLWLCFS
jgi:hydrogenase/urease accessory protein HupE